jgi:hypothetical protein
MGRRKRARTDGALQVDEELSSDLTCRASKVSRKREPHRDVIDVDSSAYIDVNGYQYVRPYVYSFQMAYKARWKGRTLVDVFCHEFSHASIDYWSTEFLQERIICNGSPASPMSGMRGIKSSIWSIDMSRQ